jgi:serine protease inhibitor
MRTELDSTDAIRNWAQELVNLRIQQMVLEDEETMSIEDAREMTLAAIREEYAKA